MPSPTLAARSRDGAYPSEAPESMPNIEWHNILLGRLLQALQWFYREAARVVADNPRHARAQNLLGAALAS
ncbi:MAG: hypothetical protein K2W96_13545, partial [Gemmataceae bacterium]|nr:hypothetical protein [Gemmataceae bacterium]